MKCDCGVKRTCFDGVTELGVMWLTRTCFDGVTELGVMWFSEQLSVEAWTTSHRTVRTTHVQPNLKRAQQVQCRCMVKTGSGQYRNSAKFFVTTKAPRIRERFFFWAMQVYFQKVNFSYM